MYVWFSRTRFSRTHFIWVFDFKNPLVCEYDLFLIHVCIWVVFVHIHVFREQTQKKMKKMNTNPKNQTQKLTLTNCLCLFYGWTRFLCSSQFLSSSWFMMKITWFVSDLMFQWISKTQIWCVYVFLIWKSKYECDVRSKSEKMLVGEDDRNLAGEDGRNFVRAVR